VADTGTLAIQLKNGQALEHNKIIFIIIF